MEVVSLMVTFVGIFMVYRVPTAALKPAENRSSDRVWLFRGGVVSLGTTIVCGVSEGCFVETLSSALSSVVSCDRVRNASA